MENSVSTCPLTWGPKYWDFLYTAAMCTSERLDSRAQKEWSGFLRNLDVYLPCHECKRNYLEYSNKMTMNFSTRKDLLDFLAGVHAHIRREDGKQAFSIEDIKKHFGKQSRTYSPPFIGAVVCILLFIYMHHK